MNNIDKCHVMIDLETYSTKSNAVIRSMAAVLFDMKGDIEVLIHTGIEIESCVMAGLEIDQDTINFWRRQPQEYRDKLYSLGQVGLYSALNELQTKVKATETELYVWGHGSNFDTVILENAYKAVGQMAWWKYSNVRDTRTLFDIANYKYVSKGGHDALEDAIHQIRAVVSANNMIKRMPF